MVTNLKTLLTLLICAMLVLQQGRRGVHPKLIEAAGTGASVHILPLFGSEVFNSSFASAPAEPTARSFSRSYAEVRSLTSLYWHTQQLTRPEFWLVCIGTRVGKINNLVKRMKTNWHQYTSVKLVGFTWCSLSLWDRAFTLTNFWDN
jgi:hypothetical protein